MGKKEQKIKNDILKNLPTEKRLFRINAGMAWAGQLVIRDKQKVVLKNPRPFHGAPAGWPDLAGWETIEITQDMVGKKIAIFCAEEIKATGSLSPDQKIFKEVLLRMGGIFRVIKK